MEYRPKKQKDSKKLGLMPGFFESSTNNSPIIESVFLYRQRVGKCKTEISHKPVPLDPWVAEQLLTWKRVTPYMVSGT